MQLTDLAVTLVSEYSSYQSRPAMDARIVGIFKKGDT